VLIIVITIPKGDMVMTKKYNITIIGGVAYLFENGHSLSSKLDSFGAKR